MESSSVSGGSSPFFEQGDASDNKQNNCSASEFEHRASIMRKKIEQKVSEIEAELKKKKNTEEEAEGTDVVGEMVEQKLVLQKQSRSLSLVELKDTVVARLQKELDKAQKELKLKDKEVANLSRIRDEVGSEIEQLTASLFEEANKMVNEANMKRFAAEKKAREAEMKLNVLQEEIVALKSLITSAVPYMSSQAPLSESQNIETPTKKSIFKKNQSVKVSHGQPICSSDVESEKQVETSTAYQRGYEPDPVFHKEFVEWRQNPNLNKDLPFLKRIYDEDIQPCMSFENKELAKKVYQAIEDNNLTVQKLSGKSPIPKLCELLNAPRFCYYQINLGDEKNYFISRLSRDRLASVCDLFYYLKYIQRGLVKQSVNEVYLEVLKKRKAIALARLGLPSDVP